MNHAAHAWSRSHVPRPWSEYSAREWTRLRPLVERYKYAGYQLQVARALRRPAAGGDLAALRSRIAGQRVLATIAFNDPGLVARQIALVRRHVADCVHLIADNSTDEAAARQIAEAAAAAGCGYLRLRPGPWTKPEQGGRSHGLAMTWVWRNLLRTARPAAFGFIDHDIFPMRPTDPFAPLEQHLVSGQRRDRSGGHGRWYLWAGFCFFRFDAVERRALNFSLDWAAGLDTGGANWFSLYRHLPPAAVSDLGVRYEPIGSDPVELRLEWIGDWLHAGNFSLPLSLPQAERWRLIANKRAVLEQRLAAALGEGPPH
jgi:hypothetical protein